MTADPTPLALTVGPLQYWWPREVTVSFYADLADSPVGTSMIAGMMPLALGLGE